MCGVLLVYIAFLTFAKITDVTCSFHYVYKQYPTDIGEHMYIITIWNLHSTCTLYCFCYHLATQVSIPPETT